MVGTPYVLVKGIGVQGEARQRQEEPSPHLFRPFHRNPNWTRGQHNAAHLAKHPAHAHVSDERGNCVIGKHLGGVTCVSPEGKVPKSVVGRR